MIVIIPSLLNGIHGREVLINEWYNKIMFKRLIQRQLEKYVRLYFIKHPEVKLVVVAGSVGKTSTKVAIATVLSQRFRVRLHEGNHNSEVSAPLAILGIEYPTSLRSLSQWMTIFKAARKRIADPSDVDIIVQEIGTERPGEIPHFGTYLHPDIAVISAISPEHMEFFKTMDAVAQEELAAANFSTLALINRDDIPSVEAKYLTNPSINTYGTDGEAEYHFIEKSFDIEKGHEGVVVSPELGDSIHASIHVLGEHNLRPAVAAAAVGIKCGMNAEEISAGLGAIRAVPGRMNVLKGQEGSLIIDDTYNSSPLAATSALQSLYSLTAPARIAVLGSMNELGAEGPKDHQDIGHLCDPTQLAWVVTVGDLANEYIAPMAKERGCQVKTCRTALEAGAFVHKVLEPGSIVLFKGSQGGIYLEEAVKVILQSTEDEQYLVRQSLSWLEKKKAFFDSFQTVQPEES